MQPYQHGAQGKLLVSPKFANLKRDTEIFTKMDPYVFIRCGKTTKRTKTHQSGGKHPRWTDTFTFEIRGETGLSFTVMDDDMIEDDMNGQFKGMIGLKYKGKHAGDLYLEVDFYSHNIQGQTPQGAQGFPMNQGMQFIYMQPQPYALQPVYPGQSVFPQMGHPQGCQYGMPPQNYLQPQMQVPQQYQQQPTQQQFYPPIGQIPQQQYIAPQQQYSAHLGSQSYPQQQQYSVPPGYQAPPQPLPPQGWQYPQQQCQNTPGQFPPQNY